MERLADSEESYAFHLCTLALKFDDFRVLFLCAVCAHLLHLDLVQLGFVVLRSSSTSTTETWLQEEVKWLLFEEHIVVVPDSP